MKKTRKAIPHKVADEVMFLADRACCICHKPGRVQIHHLDEDPENNAIENLVVLCLDHHDEASSKSSISRRTLTLGVLRRYRDDWLARVAAKREIPAVVRDSEDSFAMMVDAVAVIDIRKTAWRLEGDLSQETAEDVLSQLQYHEMDGASWRTAPEILDALQVIAGRVRDYLPDWMAMRVASVARGCLRLHSPTVQLPNPLHEDDFETLGMAIEVGKTLAYDGALDMKNLKVVEAGAELLWILLRVTRHNQLDDVAAEVQRAFETAIDGARRCGFSDGQRLLEHAVAGALEADNRWLVLPEDLHWQLASWGMDGLS